jgi:hypothetical protein
VNRNVQQNVNFVYEKLQSHENRKKDVKKKVTIDKSILPYMFLLLSYRKVFFHFSRGSRNFSGSFIDG